jgi:hypothetical protein
MKAMHVSCEQMIASTTAFWNFSEFAVLSRGFPLPVCVFLLMAGMVLLETATAI